ncbi:hypothetical protein RKE30_35910 [Streptomyces sp. Li-HN-5-11]|uniref:hypothetical protein n=1 Tax=Streptomyces sp. Li-HN-5-11 TaxID=3075432 RepID=UPI0028A8278B|nr:hypothetical protein [Streptomyces sp. Li-HN-5-11]WNM35369.1 hypothetical protein RKE30_35910 [Streptomyces sp. Li-HN-5-11]
MATGSLDHWKKFRPEELTVQDFDNWLIVVRGKQVTLGSAVLLLRRPVASLGDMSVAEATELPTVCRWFEERAAAVYKAERFNYIAAMMKDPYVHFHAFPRYSTAQHRYGVEWVDTTWPKAVEMMDVSTPESVLANIASDLRESED